MTDAGAIEFASLVDLLRRRAIEQADDRAFVLLADRGGEEAALTFAELCARAEAVARRLADRGRPGDRALLLFPNGVDFIVALFGCLIAGIIAVPVMIPRRNRARDASASIIADCAPRFALVASNLMTGARSDVAERLKGAGIESIVVDATSEDGSSSELAAGLPLRDDTAFLQYTSGSTSAPKGVMVSHGNLLDNLEMIRIAFGNTRASTHVSWVPLYHDMGLILNVLQSLYVGALCVLMTPVRFTQRPLAWLRAISDYRAEVAGGPNFAYDLCVARYRAEEMAGTDLSCWQVAFNGAEPVRASTVERFVATFRPHGLRATAIYPAYGMAEATLLASGSRRGAGVVTRRLSREALQRNEAVSPTRDDDAYIAVSSGRALIGERIAIVEPDSRRRLPLRVGEVWVAGPHVTQGYWRNRAATVAVFAARIAGEGDASWLRSGDLGFLDEAGALYITGRIKDVIIIRGINHYPQDIEDTVQNCHPALRPNAGAAFSVPGKEDEERLVIVHEVERTARNQLSAEAIVDLVHEAVMAEHDIAVHDVALILPGTLPKTTSGKVQRSLARQLWLKGELERL